MTGGGRDAHAADANCRGNLCVCVSILYACIMCNPRALLICSVSRGQHCNSRGHTFYYGTGAAPNALPPLPSRPASHRSQTVQAPSLMHPALEALVWADMPRRCTLSPRQHCRLPPPIHFTMGRGVAPNAPSPLPGHPSSHRSETLQTPLRVKSVLEVFLVWEDVRSCGV